MRKFAAVSSACAIAAGIAGFFLRRRELKTVFDPATGLAAPGATITLILAAFAVLFCGCLALALARLGNVEVSGGYSGAFGAYSPVSFYFTALAGIVILAGAVLFVVEAFKTPVLSIINVVLAVLAVASAVSVVVTAYSALRRRAGSETLLCSLIPIAFLCFWLILAYRRRAADPVLLDYVYEILALVFSILGFYFAAGFAFGKSKPRRALFCMNSAVFLNIVTLADGYSLHYVLFFAGITLTLLVNSMLLTSNLQRVGK